MRIKLFDIIKELTKEGVAREFARVAARLSRYEDKDYLRVKLGDQYGPALTSQWFRLVPTDVQSETAIKNHLSRYKR